MRKTNKVQKNYLNKKRRGDKMNHSIKLTVAIALATTITTLTIWNPEQKKFETALKLQRIIKHHKLVNKKCQENCKLNEKCCVNTTNGATTFCAPECTFPSIEIK
jgi:hypothetical protein